MNKLEAAKRRGKAPTFIIDSAEQIKAMERLKKQSSNCLSFLTIKKNTILTN